MIPHRPNHEEKRVQYIKEQTHLHNKNNITRTSAYLSYFLRNPEIHWAFLAHMVSRNGGWNMTDLHGDYLPYLLNAQDRLHLFLFLEQSNALIFHDAYPQLMLYEESKNSRRPLFHLLPHFQVSLFMQYIWTSFWSEHNKGDLFSKLTTALIINEQHVIEHGVVQQKKTQHEVIDRLFFRGQGWIQLNQVIFPLYQAYSYKEADTSLYGLILESFSNLKERIEFGKSLYELLFQNPVRRKQFITFAVQVKHTGSRHDYWPFMYEHRCISWHQQPYQQRLHHSQLISAQHKLRSPELSKAWDNVVFHPPAFHEWFQDQRCLQHFSNPKPPKIGNMTKEFRFGLEKLETAATIAQLISK